MLLVQDYKILYVVIRQLHLSPPDLIMGVSKNREPLLNPFSFLEFQNKADCRDQTGDFKNPDACFVAQKQ